MLYQKDRLWRCFVLASTGTTWKNAVLVEFGGAILALARGVWGKPTKDLCQDSCLSNLKWDPLHMKQKRQTFGLGPRCLLLVFLLRKQGSKFVVVCIPISYWEGRGSKNCPETSHTGRHFRRLWSSTWCYELRYRGFWKNLLLNFFKHLFGICRIQSLSLTCPISEDSNIMLTTDRN